MNATHSHTATSLPVDRVIAQTKKWITEVVVGCNFCPFAAREVRRDSIAYEVVNPSTAQPVLSALRALLHRMSSDAGIETAFLILPTGFGSFAAYLKLLASANALLRKEGFEGVYQLASFHPQYLFAGSRPADAANYTNRSPHPMLQILREASVSAAVDGYPDTAKIPERNTAYARQKGLAHMRSLLEASFKASGEREGNELRP